MPERVGDLSYCQACLYGYQQVLINSVYIDIQKIYAFVLVFITIRKSIIYMCYYVVLG